MSLTQEIGAKKGSQKPEASSQYLQKTHCPEKGCSLKLLGQKKSGYWLLSFENKVDVNFSNVYSFFSFDQTF